MSDKPKYSVESAGNGRARVVENSTGLVMRTLDSRSDANDWISAVEAPRERK